MNEWQFVVHQKALETIDGLPRAERRDIRNALRSLVADPWQQPTALIRPSNDRARLYLIYWIDEFAREVRLVCVDVPQ